MARQNINFFITGDAQSLITALKQSGTQLESLDKSTAKGATSTKSFGSELAALGRQLVAGIGLGVVVNEIRQFVTESEQLGRNQKDLRNALVSTLGSAQEYDRAIKLAKQATEGMVTETQAAQANLIFLKSGIAANVDESAKLISSGNALVNTYRAQGASFELLIRLLNSGNKVLLDNFNITSEQVNARKALIERTQGLSGEEAKLAAIKEIVIENGQALNATLSEETKALQRSQAATEDFKAAFGELISGAFVPGRNAAAGFFEQMTAGAKAYDYIIEQSKTLELALRASIFAGADFGETFVALNEATAEAARSEERLIKTQQVARDLEEQRGAYIEAAAERRKNQALVNASTFEQLTALQEQAVENERRFQQTITEATKNGANERKSIQQSADDEITQLNLTTARRRAEIIASGTAQNKEQLNARLQDLDRAAAQEREKIQTAADEELRIQATKEAELKRRATEARQEELKKQERQLQEIILLATLKQAEAAGTLENLTGIAGLNAEQALGLFTSGAKRISAETQTAISQTAKQLETDAGRASREAEANFNRIGTALATTTTTSSTTAVNELNRVNQVLNATIPQSAARTSQAVNTEFIKIQGDLTATTKAANATTEAFRAAAAASVQNLIRSGGVTGRQYGGPLAAYQPTVVGEAGPEIFRPTVPGNVVSNQNVRNYNLSVANPMPSNSIIQDFSMMEARAG